MNAIARTEPHLPQDWPTSQGEDARGPEARNPAAIRLARRSAPPCWQSGFPDTGTVPGTPIRMIATKAQESWSPKNTGELDCFLSGIARFGSRVDYLSEHRMSQSPPGSL